MVSNGRFVRKQREVGLCRVENTETKVEYDQLDYPALSCNDVSARTSMHHSGERASSRPAKGTTDWVAAWLLLDANCPVLLTRGGIPRNGLTAQ